MRSTQLKERWRDWLMLLLGVWLLISPFVLGYAAAQAGMLAIWNPVIVGVAVIVFAIAVLRKTQMWEEWTLLLLGVWLVISPFILGYAGIEVALWNSIIVGLLVGADAAWSLMVLRSHRHKTA